MRIVQFFSNLNLISERKRLEWYPPFWFMGVKVIDIGSDYRSVELMLPIKWYGLNMYGTMFGGFMCAVSDPMPVLLCQKIFPGTQTYTKAHTLEFLKPGRTNLTLRIQISEEEVKKVAKALDIHHEATHTFEYSFWDKRQREVAKIKNTVFLRRKK